MTAFTNGAPADLVIGQPDPTRLRAIPTPTGQSHRRRFVQPVWVAVDAAGNLYVADEAITGCSNTPPHSPSALHSRALGGPPIWCSGRAAAPPRPDAIPTPREAIPPPTTCVIHPASQLTPPATSTSPTQATTACSNTTHLLQTAPPPIWYSGKAAASLRTPRIRAERVHDKPLLPHGVAVDATGNLYVADSTTAACSNTTLRLRT